MALYKYVYDYDYDYVWLGCLCLTSRCSIKTHKHIITQQTMYDSPGTLAFTARCYASAVYAVVVHLSVRPSVRPSVCLSVTSRHCTKTAKHSVSGSRMWCPVCGALISAMPIKRS